MTIAPETLEREKDKLRALTLVKAADALGCKRRWLEYWLKSHPVDATGNPFYVPVAGRKTFEDADIARIRAVIRVTKAGRAALTPADGGKP